MGQTVVKSRLDEESGRRRAIHVPDHLAVLARMACGAQATFLVSSVTGNAPANGITLYGSKATLQFADGVLSGGGRSDGGLQPITVPAEERGAWRVEEEFINAIRGDEPVRLTTFGDGLKYMAFTEAVARSLAERRGENAVEIANAAIYEAKAVSSSEAFEAGLVDFIVEDVDELIVQLDGFEVEGDSWTQTINTQNASQTHIPMLSLIHI